MEVSFKMAVTTTKVKDVVQIKLNNGESETTGKVSTLNVNLGTLSESGYTNEKAMVCVNALSVIFTKPLYTTYHVETTELEDDGN